MPLYYITGISGAGKSTLCNELKKRGLNAFDGDDISSWINNETGIAEKRPKTPAGRSKQWVYDHSWNMSPEKLAAIRIVHAGEDIFLFGNSTNRYEI